MTVHEAIDNAVNTFVASAINSLDFLTEDDMRCWLFGELQRALPRRLGNNAISIHSEVRWYGDMRGNRRLLKYRSDIVIIDDSTLREGDIIFRAPSKGYGFNEYYAIIELKLRRFNGVGNDRFIDNLRTEIDRLEEIRRLTSSVHSPKYYLVVFDKRRNIQDAIPRANEILIHYKYLNPTTNQDRE